MPAPADAAQLEERRHGGASAPAARVAARFSARVISSRPTIFDDQRSTRQFGGEIFALALAVAHAR